MELRILLTLLLGFALAPGSFARNAPPLVDDPGPVVEIRSLPAGSLPVVVRPELVWEYENGSGELLFGAIRSATLDAAGRLYLLDATLDGWHVLDLQGDYLREIRAVGEGPGEYREASGLSPLGEGELLVRQAFPPALAVLSTEGAPLRTLALRDGAGERESGMLTSAWPVPGGFLVGHQFDRQQGKRSLQVFSFDRHGTDGVQVVELARHEEERLPHGQIMVGDAMPFHSATVLGDGSFVVGLDYDDFRLAVFPPEGDPWVLVDPAYAPVARPAEAYREAQGHIEDSARRIGIPAPKLSAFERAITHILDGPDGRLRVDMAGPRDGCPEGSFGPFREFDLQGVEHARYAVELAYDPGEDIVSFLPGHLLVVRHGLDGLRAHFARFNSAAEDEEEEEGEAEPMRLEFHRLVFPGL